MEKSSYEINRLENKDNVMKARGVERNRRLYCCLGIMKQNQVRHTSKIIYSRVESLK